MKIHLEYTAQLRVRAGCPEETLELPDDTSLSGLLEAAAERHAAPLREMLLDAEGHVGSTILCFVADEQVDWENPPSLNDGVRVSLMSPISGG